MKKSYCLFYLLLFISFNLLFISCEKRKLRKSYEGCCGTEPLILTFNNSESIYLPNIFTPNQDGYNDRFTPYASQNITINSFVIKNRDKEVVFQKTEIHPNDWSEGWDSTRDGNGIDSLRGLFIYEITATSNGEVKSNSGSVCVYYCGDSGFPDDNIEDCHFGSQHNGIGNLDETLPTYEDDCF